MKKATTIILLLLGLMSAGARNITPSEAYSKAQIFFGETPSSITTYSAQNIEPAFTAVNDNNENTLYVFNNTANDGFVIIAGDDCVESVLGYCEEGSFDYNQAPPAMMWLLEEYQREIAYIKSNNLKARTSQSPFNKDAAPLLSTQWGQHHPYNALCPQLDNGNRCVTGCVATAMSQIMYYHQWPTKGKGSKSYTTRSNSFKLSVDFSKTTYQWSKMTDTYDENSTSQSCDAVAQIMYHAGVASEMDYGEASGTSAGKAACALVNNFDYDKSISNCTRDYYTTAQWEKLIAENIDNKQPIIYLGTSSKEGHAFILDGYNSNGFVHIDWGWSGFYNGYFKLSTLDATNDGDGYASNQSAIFNIIPNKGSNHIAYEIVAENLFVTDGTYVAGDNITVEATSIFNHSIESLQFELGIGIYDTNDQLIKSIKLWDADLDMYYGYKSLNNSFTAPQGLENGNYTLHLIHNANGTSWEKVKMKGGEDYAYANVYEDIIRISEEAITNLGFNIYLNDGTVIPIRTEKLHFYEEENETYISLIDGIAGTYSAYGTTAFKNEEDEQWSIEITYDNTIENRVWLHPICLLGGPSVAQILPVYATYDAENNTLTLPLGQCVYGGEGQSYNMLIATTDRDSQPVTSGSLTLTITTQNGIRTITLNELLGVGNVATDTWWYQALTSITMTARYGVALPAVKKISATPSK